MKKYITLVLLGLIGLSSCHKKDNSIDGPNLNDVYGEFGVISALGQNLDSVDFSIGQTAFFTAEMTKIIDWKITITGQTTGAVKEISGTSNNLSQVNATWIGETTLFPVFGVEVCDVMLTFDGEDDTLTSTIKIIDTKLNPGFLISDFESGFNNQWTSFIQSGADMDFQVKSDAFSPEGGSYFNMAGTVDWDWLIGYVYFGANAYGSPQLPITGNGDNTYFNLMIYGEPGSVNTLVLFQFQEDDDLSGGFSDASEDMYSLEIPVTWEGWRLVSVKYSDIPCLVNGQPSTPNGNAQHNPDRLNQVNMLHLANPVSGHASTKVDYIIFTENEPLKP